jgi:hypothetical protein
VPPQQTAAQPPAAPTLPPQPSAPPAPAPDVREVSWTASEFIAHEKGAKWYGILALATLLLAAVAYLFTHDILAVVAIVVVACIFGYVAGHQPRILSYRLDDHGLTIAHKAYQYGVFKSFSLVDEEAFSSITLMPLRRFMPPISIYFAPEDEEKVVGVLGRHLPVSQSHDLIDHFMRRIKF